MDMSVEAQAKRLATMSAFSYIPPRRKDPKELNYYNRESTAPEVFTYDQVFHQPLGYDERLHRDDRKHHKGRGLDIAGEIVRQAVVGSIPMGRSRHYVLNGSSRVLHEELAKQNKTGRSLGSVRLRAPPYTSPSNAPTSQKRCGPF